MANAVPEVKVPAVFWPEPQLIRNAIPRGNISAVGMGGNRIYWVGRIRSGVFEEGRFVGGTRACEEELLWGKDAAGHDNAEGFFGSHVEQLGAINGNELQEPCRGIGRGGDENFVAVGTVHEVDFAGDESERSEAGSGEFDEDHLALAGGRA